MRPDQKALVVSTIHVVANHQRLVAITNAGQFIKPKFMKVNAAEIAIEQGDTPDNVKNKWLSMPVYDSLYINLTSYTNSNPQVGTIGETIVVAKKSYYFDKCLITVSQTKNIVKTPIVGRNGTVKEYVSDGDYEIKVQGMIVGKHANIRPDIGELNALAAILDAPVALEVGSNFLDMFRISSMVVESYEMTQIEGTRNAIGFTMTCSSDEIKTIQYQNLKAGRFGSVLSF